MLLQSTVTVYVLLLSSSTEYYQLIGMFILTFVIFGQVDGTKCHCVQLNVFAGHVAAPSYAQKTAS